MTPGFAQVALPLPLPEPYTYRIPDALVDRVLPGPASWYRSGTGN